MSLKDRDLGVLSKSGDDPITWWGHGAKVSFEIEGDESGPFDELKERVFYVEKDYYGFFTRIQKFLRANTKKYAWFRFQKSWEIEWVSFYKNEANEFRVRLLFDIDDSKPMEKWIGDGEGFVGNGVFIGELLIRNNEPVELVMENTNLKS